MNNMKKYKWQLLLSSLLVMAPAAVGAIFWNELPSLMASHVSLTGEADGFATKAFVVLGIPLILLALHWLCVLLTFKDAKMKEQSPKVITLVLWILPAASVFVAGLTYSIAAGQVLSVYRLLPLFLGVLFIAVGNYMPKCRQNFYLGIKLRWTLLSERNWAATHRYAGKVWVAGGAAMLVTAALPMTLGVILLVAIAAVAVILPTVYSYRLFRVQVARGELEKDAKIPMTKGQKKVGVFSVVTAGIVLIAVAILMFTGSIHVTCDDTAVTVEASYYRDITIDYDRIVWTQYFDELDVGIRTMGFGSARLLMGSFQNEQFGDYTLYAYRGSDAYIAVGSGDEVIVVGMKESDDPQAVYETILEHING